MTKFGEIEEIPTTANHQFSNFDVVTDHSDHHFSTTSKQISSRTVNKKIMQEWKILEKNLPDSIYVRVYETRIDLLRAVIVGAAGTPYHDGLFFFDLAFPSDYPNRPPQVYYRSFGMRLNPNLYSSGTVCLSLLNTWPGREKHETWERTRSTVLQVLVSIQALVLNEKPFYNEPLTSTIRGLMNSLSLAYNDSVFVLSCKTMLQLLRNPPKNFEEFIAGHFRERATDILRSCYYYMDGRARVGKINGCSDTGHVKVSSRFRNSMKPVYDELVAAFTKNGSSLSHFIVYDELVAAFTKNGSSLSHFIEQMAEEKVAAQSQEKSKRESSNRNKFHLYKIVHKIKEMLKLKKNNRKAKVDAKTMAIA